MKLIFQLLEELIIQKEIITKKLKLFEEMTIMIIRHDKKDSILKKIHQEIKLILQKNLISINT